MTKKHQYTREDETLFTAISCEISSADDASDEDRMDDFDYHMNKARAYFQSYGEKERIKAREEIIDEGFSEFKIEARKQSDILGPTDFKILEMTLNAVEKHMRRKINPKPND